MTKLTKTVILIECAIFTVAVIFVHHYWGNNQQFTPELIASKLTVGMTTAQVDKALDLPNCYCEKNLELDFDSYKLQLAHPGFGSIFKNQSWTWIDFDYSCHIRWLDGGYERHLSYMPYDFSAMK